MGLTICYDLCAFLILYQHAWRSKRRSVAFAVPAAFTVPTGAAHWHVLLRARAIESAAFVIAAAQSGKHADGRETYGHSLVVDPWGDGHCSIWERERGLVLLTLTSTVYEAVRAQIPGAPQPTGYSASTFDRVSFGPDMLVPARQ